MNLCLNGKQIIQNYTYGKGMRFPTVIVRRDATLNLCDCRPEGAVGKITHASDMMGSGIEVRGKFKDVTGEAGVLNLYNAEISGNKQTSAGCRKRRRCVQQGRLQYVRRKNHGQRTY